MEENFDNLRLTPFPNNSLNIVDSKDFGIIKNIRPNLQANTYSIDLNYNEMNVVLNKIINIEYSIEIENNLINNLCKNLIYRINEIFKKFNLNNKFHPNDKREYKLINYEVLKEEYISKLTNSIVVNIKFHKKMKDVVFNIQCKILYSKETKTYVIKNINIIGLELNEKLYFDNFNQEYCNLEKKKNSKLKNCHENIISNKSMNTFFENLIKGDKSVITPEEIIFFKEKNEEKKKNEDHLKYICFDNEGFNESTCNSFSVKTGKKGTWDKPCTNDKECPFFMKNKNYPNKRGGCLKGYCEMPTNIERKGFKKYNTKIKPFCHNCNIKNCIGEECFTCCNIQVVPDYMFENDTNQRNNYFK